MRTTGSVVPLLSVLVSVQASLLLDGCLRFSARPKPNTAPVAVPSATEELVTAGAVIVLDGSASSDSDGDALAFRWEIASSVDAIVIPEPTAQVTTVTMPQRGQVVFIRLIVNDGAVDSVAALVRIRVNTPPRVDAGATRTASAPIFFDATAIDGENDEMSAWEWKVTKAPAAQSACMSDAASCIADPHLQSIRFEPAEAGEYELAVRANDGAAWSAWDVVTVIVLQGNRAPVLGLTQTSETAVEGSPFSAISAAASTDPDGDPITVVWTKVDGSEAFPETLVGTQPAPTAPAFLPLIPGSNAAHYSVVASDGSLTSEAQEVTLYVAPGAGFVIVSDAANAADAPLCGTRSFPCRSLAYAFARVDPDNDGVGDGRDIVMTSASFVQLPTAVDQGLAWKSGTSLYGGRDATTFARKTRTQLLLNSDLPVGCVATRPGFVLGNTSVGIEIDNVALSQSVAGCDGLHFTVACNGCGVTFTDSEISAAGGGAGAIALQTSAAAVVTVKNSKLHAANAFNFNRCILAGGATQLSIEDSLLVTAASSPSISGADNSVLRSNGSFITARRSAFRISGAYSNVANGQPTAAIFLNGGSFFGENVDIVETVHEDFSAVLVQAGTQLTLIHATIVGPASASGTGAAISTPSVASVMNTLVFGFRTGLSLTNAAAYGSRLYGNLFSGVNTAMVCGSGAIGAASDLNGAAAMASPGSGASCNGSAQTWTNNQSGTCPFIDEANFDFRLAIDQPNACQDAALSSSVVGASPTDDKEQAPRPQGSAPDVGSDEGGARP